jgi:hypothetical protein
VLLELQERKDQLEIQDRLVQLDQLVLMQLRFQLF